jgi:hypothetical protein
LEYLRTGELIVGDLTSSEKRRLKGELDYFQIAPPLPVFPEVTWDPNYCGHKIKLSEEDTLATKLEGGVNAAVLGRDPVERFTVVAGNGVVRLGFGLRGNFSKEEYDYAKCGWNLLSTGALYGQDRAVTTGYSPTITGGTRITAYHNKAKHEISFSVDGKSLGVAFKNVSASEELYPVVGASHGGCTISLHPW